MESFEFSDNKELELSELHTLNIYSEIKKFKEKIINTFKQINLSTNEMSIYYERQSNGSSILAIKLSQGDDYDEKNYMLNGCLTEYYDNEVLCDIGFHANAKVSKYAMQIANKNSKDIVLFFKKIEKEIFDKGLSNIEISIRIMLSNSEEDLNKKGKQSKIRRLF